MTALKLFCYKKRGYLIIKKTIGVTTNARSYTDIYRLICWFYLLLFLPSSFATSTHILVNTSPVFDYVLTKVVNHQVTCEPNCVLLHLLKSGMSQQFIFNQPSDSIKLTYNVYKKTIFQGKIILWANKTGFTLKNGLGAQLTELSNASTWALDFTPPTSIWKGLFPNPHDFSINNWNMSKLPSWGLNNIKILESNALNGSSPHKDNYLQIQFPAGSANSASSPPLPLGGAQFYGAMKNTEEPITLSYFIRFPIDFPFDFLMPTTSDPYTLGKLPGLYGGEGNNNHHIPTGLDGWTTRFMWCNYIESSKQKVRAGGEVLLFTKNSNEGPYGHSYGTNLGCNNWHFSADGKWHNLQQTIHLNTPGIANGRIDVCYDGKLVLTENNIIFRVAPELAITGIVFQTFFGGSGSDYSTPTDTSIDFADFALYAYPNASPLGLCITNP